MVKIVWPGHTEEELTRIILEYMTSDESAVFAEKRAETFIGVALCCLRYDYVEGCETSPVGYLEGVSVKETCRNQGIAKRLVEECEQWARNISTFFLFVRNMPTDYEGWPVHGNISTSWTLMNQILLQLDFLDGIFYFYLVE